MISRFVAFILLSGQLWLLASSWASADTTSAIDNNAEFQRLLGLAEKGEVEAQSIVGWMYFQGTVVGQDVEKALFWLGKAAEIGDPGSKYNYAMISLGQTTSNAEKIKAVGYIEEAASQGLAAAQYNLGVWYYTGALVTDDLGQPLMDIDHRKAFKWTKLAAEQGVVEAQFNLGVMYIEGKAVARDIHKAVHFYQKAAEQGNAGAQLNLGKLYFHGNLVLKNYKEAEKWLLMAANSKVIPAAYILSLIYMETDGNQTGPMKAYKWFRIATSLDGKDGGSLNEKLRLELTLKQVKEAEREIALWLAEREELPAITPFMSPIN